MGIHVFDSAKKVVEIKLEDVINIKRINRRLCYLTESGLFFGAINLKEQALLYMSLGFFQADKNSLVNINKIEKIVGKSVIAKGIRYPISRRNLAKIIKLYKE